MFVYTYIPLIIYPHIFIFRALASSGHRIAVGETFKSHEEFRLDFATFEVMEKRRHRIIRTPCRTDYRFEIWCKVETCPFHLKGSGPNGIYKVDVPAHAHTHIHTNTQTHRHTDTHTRTHTHTHTTCTVYTPHVQISHLVSHTCSMSEQRAVHEGTKTHSHKPIMQFQGKPLARQAEVRALLQKHGMRELKPRAAMKWLKTTFSLDSNYQTVI